MASTAQHRLAYGLLSPTLVLTVLSGVIPFALVVYFSLHDTFAGEHYIWVHVDVESVLDVGDVIGGWGLEVLFGLVARLLEIQLVGLLDSILNDRW